MNLTTICLLLVTSAFAESNSLTSFDMKNLLENLPHFKGLMTNNSHSFDRRLQAWMGAACMAKCPKVQKLMEDMVKEVQKDPKMAEDAKKLLAFMCKHAEALTCVATNDACLDADATQAAGMMAMPCLCSCPDLGTLDTTEDPKKPSDKTCNTVKCMKTGAGKTSCKPIWDVMLKVPKNKEYVDSCEAKAKAAAAADAATSIYAAPALGMVASMIALVA